MTDDVSDNRPRLAIVVVAVWALIQTVRVSAVGLAQSVLAGSGATNARKDEVALSELAATSRTVIRADRAARVTRT
jgi:hypothetical protein